MLTSQVISGSRPEIPSPSALKYVPKGYLTLMKKCWETDAKLRPSMSEVKSKLMQIGRGVGETREERKQNKKQMKRVAMSVAFYHPYYDGEGNVLKSKERNGETDSLYSKNGVSMLEVFKSADKDGDGIVTFDEITEFMTKKKTRKEKIKHQPSSYEEIFKTSDHNGGVEVSDLRKHLSIDMEMTK